MQLEDHPRNAFGDSRGEFLGTEGELVVAVRAHGLGQYGIAYHIPNPKISGAPLAYLCDQFLHELPAGSWHPTPSWDVLALGPLLSEYQQRIGKPHPKFVAHLQAVG